MSDLEEVLMTCTSEEEMTQVIMAAERVNISAQASSGVS